MMATAYTEICLVGFDVDGVMTDGGLIYHDDARESKTFNTLDGQGIKLLHQAGIATAIISGRRSHSVDHRAADLGINHVFQGVQDKYTVFDQLRQKLGYTWSALAFMGDDLPDLAVMQACGIAAAPVNAIDLVQQCADWISTRPGGHGAVREFIDHLLYRKGKLQSLQDSYRCPPRTAK